MRLGIMQPYLFPYLGYFQLIDNADCFILLNAVQYIRHGWMNRNRILKPGEGWQFIVLPLQPHHQTDKIATIRYQPHQAHRDKILRQLQHYKKRAPQYDHCMNVVAESLLIPEDGLGALNAHTIKQCCKYLGITTPIKMNEELDLQLNQVQHAGEWALTICQQLKASAYVNPIAGAALFEPNDFRASNIELWFLKAGLPEYSQRRSNFEPGLSIIDVMMFNEPLAIRQMIKSYTLEQFN